MNSINVLENDVRKYKETLLVMIKYDDYLKALKMCLKLYLAQRKINKLHKSIRLDYKTIRGGKQ